MVYIVERLVLQTIYVLNKKILQFWGLKSAVYNQERVIMEPVRYLRSVNPAHLSSTIEVMLHCNDAGVRA